MRALRLLTTRNSVCWLLNIGVNSAPAALSILISPIVLKTDVQFETCYQGWSKLKYLGLNARLFQATKTRSMVCVHVCVCFLGLTLSREWPISRPTALAQCLVTVAGPLLSANLVRWSSGVWHMGRVGTLSELCLLIYLIIVHCTASSLFSPN